MVGTVMRTPSALNGCAKSKYEVLHVHDGMARVRPLGMDPLGMDQELHISVDKLLTVVPVLHILRWVSLLCVDFFYKGYWWQSTSSER